MHHLGLFEDLDHPDRSRRDESLRPDFLLRKEGGRCPDRS